MAVHDSKERKKKRLWKILKAIYDIDKQYKQLTHSESPSISFQYMSIWMVVAGTIPETIEHICIILKLFLSFTAYTAA